MSEYDSIYTIVREIKEKLLQGFLTKFASDFDRCFAKIHDKCQQQQTSTTKTNGDNTNNDNGEENQQQPTTLDNVDNNAAAEAAEHLEKFQTLRTKTINHFADYLKKKLNEIIMKILTQDDDGDGICKKIINIVALESDQTLAEPFVRENRVVMLDVAQQLAQLVDDTCRLIETKHNQLTLLDHQLVEVVKKRKEEDGTLCKVRKFLKH